MESIGGPEDDVRWARVLCELAREAWRRCEKSAWMGHTEITMKLQDLISLDSTSRQILPCELGLSRGVLARRYAMIASAAPLLDATIVSDKSMTSRELVRLFVSTARAGGEFAGFALGCMDSSCHTLVVSEVSGLLGSDDHNPGGGGSGKAGAAGRGSRGRKDDALRLVQAHILRVLSSNVPQGSLSRNTALRDKLVEFVAETMRHISLAVDVTPELQQLRYCLCGVSKQAAIQLAEVQPQAFPPMLRKQLFDKFSLYCEDGQTPGTFFLFLYLYLCLFIKFCSALSVIRLLD